MADQRRKFPREFKIEAVPRVTEGRETAAEVARARNPRLAWSRFAGHLRRRLLRVNDQRVLLLDVLYQCGGYCFVVCVGGDGEGPARRECELHGGDVNSVASGMSLHGRTAHCHGRHCA